MCDVGFHPGGTPSTSMTSNSTPLLRTRTTRVEEVMMISEHIIIVKRFFSALKSMEIIEH
jgi:hypothetical protein